MENKNNIIPEIKIIEKIIIVPAKKEIDKFDKCT